MVGSRAATRSETTGGGQTRYTVVGLFDDQLDMQDALAALRKANQPPEQISVVVLDPDAGEDSRAERALAVARALAATALDHVGSWLQGLAELIVPERGTFVVAGPLGAALAGIGSGDVQASVPLPGTAATPPASDPSPGPSAAALVRTLQEFGFGADEATYVESRLAAGAPLIGVTAVNQVELQRVRRILAEHNAVHIGMARTDARIADQAQALLAAPPERSSGGDVVVTDAVAPLRRLCDGEPTAWSAELCGRDVVDADGTDAGSIDDLLAEPVGHATPDAGRAGLRYVIVAYGGVLGLGRRRVPVPAAQIDLDASPARLAFTKGVLQDAPAYDEGPFSRHEEQVVCAYFGCTPYWITE